MKKLRYIPGMFSIILLPLLGYIYFQSNGYFKQFGAFDIAFMDFEELEEINREYDNIINVEEYGKRTYTEVTLNHDKNAEITFKYIDQFVDNVIQTRDTINGLKIHFEKNATYSEFIEVLNIFNERDARMYLLDNNTMYFVGRDLPSKDIVDIDCAGIIYHQLEQNEIFKQATWGDIKSQFLQSKIIYSAYFIFVFVALTYLIKRKST